MFSQMADPNVIDMRVCPQNRYSEADLEVHCTYKSKHDQEQAGVGSGWGFLGVSVYYDL